MPMMAGRVGAIHAAQRRSRESRSGLGSFNPPPRASISKTASSSPMEGAIGRMAWLKKQVQKKVESGIKMVSSATKDPEKDKRDWFHKDAERKGSSTSLTADRAPPPQDSARSNSTLLSSANGTMLPAAWIKALAEMGFDRAQAMEAVAMIGEKPAELEDLLEALVAMTASPTASDAAAASSGQDRDGESVSSVAGHNFSITLHKVPGASLGIEVRTGKSKVLIDSIRDGLMTEWNTQNPDSQVEAGDQILGINGKKCSASELVALLQGTSTLEISMFREARCETTRTAHSEGASSSSLAEEPDVRPSDHLACTECGEGEVKDEDLMDAPAVEETDCASFLMDAPAVEETDRASFLMDAPAVEEADRASCLTDAPAVEDDVTQLQEKLASGLTQVLRDGFFEKYLATQSSIDDTPATNLESLSKHEPEAINSSNVFPIRGGA